jgi:oligopeptide/dipeptide ABC transporter ATP-binding protein
VSAVLEIRNLTARFRTAEITVEAVRGLDLDIAEGEVLGLIGESGSGKTVTGLALLRLLPAHAEVVANRIEFCGRSLLGLPDKEFRALRGRQLAMIFQNPTGSFNPAKTILWHLAKVAQRRGAPSKAGQRFADLERRLAEVGIPSPGQVLRRYPHQLSGGMLQRALIAMVLLLEPRFIIADEPTTNLDNIVERQILGLLRKLQARTRASILFITHDMTAASGLCDRIAVMYAGEIVETGPATEILSAPRHPYTQGLVATGRQLDQRTERLSEIPGEMPSSVLPGCPFAPRCPKADAACREARPAATQLSAQHDVRCFHHG